MPINPAILAGFADVAAFRWPPPRPHFRTVPPFTLEEWLRVWWFRRTGQPVFETEVQVRAELGRLAAEQTTPLAAEIIAVANAERWDTRSQKMLLYGGTLAITFGVVGGAVAGPVGAVAFAAIGALIGCIFALVPWERNRLMADWSNVCGRMRPCERFAVIATMWSVSDQARVRDNHRPLTDPWRLRRPYSETIRWTPPTDRSQGNSIGVLWAAWLAGGPLTGIPAIATANAAQVSAMPQEWQEYAIQEALTRASLITCLSYPWLARPTDLNDSAFTGTPESFDALPPLVRWSVGVAISELPDNAYGSDALETNEARIAGMTGRGGVFPVPGISARSVGMAAVQGAPWLRPVLGKCTRLTAFEIRKRLVQTGLRSWTDYPVTPQLQAALNAENARPS